MKIHDITVYNGRNIYCHRPVMKMVLDIGKYGNIPTKAINGFNDRLLKAFPGLKNNYCGLGYEGGFLEKLNSGTYLAHVLEHVILEMQFILGYEVRYGKTRIIKEPSLYYLVYEYQNESCALECSKTAVYILDCLIKDKQINIDEFIEPLRKISIETELGPSTSAIVAEAKKRNIPITRIGNGSLIQLAYGKYLRTIQSTLTDATSCISADISSNKQLTKQILKNNQIPVPDGKIVYSERSALMAADKIGRPVAIKPYDGCQGKGVYLNLTGDSEILTAFKEASKYSNAIIVERYIEGNDYRILVVGGKVKAVAQRLPPAVIGDGVHSIEELINITNSDVRRGDHHEKPLTKIKLDGVILNVLEKKGISKDYIPPKGDKIILRENGNLSTGGTAIDCTDDIHPDNAEIASRAAIAIGLDIAGVDIVTTDISKSIYETGGAVVEVNTTPGIRMHLYPNEGKPRNVAKDIVDMLYPDDDYTKFTIVSITGSNGRTATTQLISHLLSHTGKSVGSVCNNEFSINGNCIYKENSSGSLNKKMVLFNKSIDTAIIEMPYKDILREGLSYDLADIGVITDIASNLVGEDGIYTPEDLAFIKALIVEAIKPTGCAVLNAKDKMTDYILKRVKAKIILFSDSFCNKYNSTDYTQVFIDESTVKIKDSNQTIDILQVEDIPTFRKASPAYSRENLLAAIATLHGLNIPINLIVTGLKSLQN